MHTFWVTLGIVVLVLGFLDVFLTALNYDESGFLATPMCMLQWRCIRSITRRLSRRWRPVALRQVTGLQIVLSVMTWLGCVVLGFGFIYYGLMAGADFQYDGRGLGNGMFSAMYLSAAQLSTVGTSQISPQTDTLRALTIAETTSSLVLVTMILTFLLGVYQVVRDLRALSSNFLLAEPDTGDAIANLAPYFQQGQPVGLDSHLQAISESFWAYADGVHLHHIAYYFQSGRDQFSLPYALHMIGRTLAALRWGLPTGHSASADPTLTRLTLQFERFSDYLHDKLGWTSVAVPAVVSFDDFSAACRGVSAAPDLWLDRFLRLNRDMARLAGCAPTEDRMAYERYRQWLPFAYRAEQVTAAVSRDLDYQPIVRDGEPARPVTSSTGAGVLADHLPAMRALAQLWRMLINRWVAVPDPGLTRLLMAARATLAAIAAVSVLYLLFSIAGIPVLPAAMFGGMVGMLAVAMPGDATAASRKLTTVLLVLPAVGAAVLGVAVAPSFFLSTAVLVVVVLLGVRVGAFGSRFAALGQMGFMAYYFTLPLHLRFTELPAFAIAAAMGVIWAYLFRFVFIAERPEWILRDGLDAFRARLVLVLNPLIDAISAARWDPDVRKRVDADLRQLHRCAAFLQGQLRAIDAGAELNTRTGELRLLVFDTELAATNAAEVARHIARAGTVIPVALRGQLAGLLNSAQDQLRSHGLIDASPPSASMPPAYHKKPEDKARLPEGWPEEVCRLYGAIQELLQAARTMRNAQTAALTDARVAAREVGIDMDPSALQTAPASERRQLNAETKNHGLLVPSSRRAVQAAVATTLALLAGMAVTSGNQYWAALAAFLVLGGTETVEETGMKGMQRIAGTVAGALLGFGVTILTRADPAAILPLAALCAFAAMYFRPVSYTLMAFWVTMLIALLYEFLGTLTIETLKVRVLETVIGAVIALSVATFLLPVRTRQKVNRDGVVFLQTLDDIVQTCLERLAGSSDIPSLGRQALALGQGFRQLNIRAEPLRRTSGALRLGGIERRLTAAAALTYYARHLIRATELSDAGTVHLSAKAYAQLAAFTRDNISALIQILNDESPGPVHKSGDFPFQSDISQNQPEESLPEREPVHYLARINQTVLTLIEDLTRVTTESSRYASSPLSVP